MLFGTSQKFKPANYSKHNDLILRGNMGKYHLINTFCVISLPFQHLPLQEAVKVHAALEVGERCPTQVVMDGPEPTRNQGELTGQATFVHIIYIQGRKRSQKANGR